MKVFETEAVTGEQLLAFGALILPGFISLRVYDRLRGGEGRKINEVLVVIVYSLATDLIALGELALVSRTVPGSAQLAAKVIVAVVTLSVFPVLLAFIWFDFERRMTWSGFINEMAPKLLESMLDRVVRERIDLGAIVTLRDGRKVGARVRSPAYTRSRATDDELLLGEVWTIDQECATFISAVNGSVGIVIKRADCETIEFIQWPKRHEHS